MFDKVLVSWRTLKGRHPILFELTLSITFGVLIEFFLSFMPPLSIVRHVGDNIADWMIQVHEGITNNIPTSPAFVFIDIDDATFKAWGSPLVMPRANIAILLERVARSEPLAIILDVDLAYSDRTDGKTLKHFLGNYEHGWPPLLLVRDLIDDPEGGLPQPRKTDYDDAIVSKDNIAFASPLFERDSDGKVRRWRLFAEACDGGAPIVVPSMHLAAAMIARQSIYAAPPGDKDTPLKRMTKDLAGLTPANCTDVNGVRVGALSSSPFAPPIRIENDDVSQRVIYRIAWKPHAIGLGPVVDRPGGGEAQLVTVRPARLAVPADINAALPRSPLPGLEGRIVVVGGSFESGGDRYDTPLGVMPGSLMIINAVEALAQNGTPREFPPLMRIVISLFVIVVASLLTSFLRPIVAATALIFVLLLLMFAFLKSFQAGEVLDLAVPAVGAFLHYLGESAVTTAEDIWQHRWCWLKNPRADNDRRKQVSERIAKKIGDE
jgi:CHASE2 domain-containing sensor protein